MPDLYDLLAAPPGASEEQLRSAYRRTLRKYDPDRFPVGSTERRRAAAMTRAAVAAWDVLGEPVARSAYDASLAAPIVTASIVTAQVVTDPRPVPGQRAVRALRALPSPRSAETRAEPSDPAALVLALALRTAADVPTSAEAAGDLHAAALDELPGTRARADGASDRVVAAAALTAARRELAARYPSRRPVLDAVAGSALVELRAPAPVAAVVPLVTVPAPPTDTGSRSGVVRLLALTAALLWMVLAFRLLYAAPASATGWSTHVAQVVGLAVVLVGPWWLLGAYTSDRPEVGGRRD